MRRIIIFMAMMITASCAYADVQEFRYFSLDVPEGWTANEENEKGSVVTVRADDDSGSLVITAGNPDGRDIADIAREYSLRVEGDTPELDDEGNYTFSFNSKDNKRSEAFITGDRDFYMIIIANGIENDSGELGEILESLEMK